MTGLEFQLADFNEAALEPHLRMRIRVVDDRGKEVAASRDLQALQEKFGRKAQRQFMDRQGQGVNRDGALSWEFGELPQQRNTPGGAPAWPALVDQDTAVGLRLFDTFGDAWLSHQAGVLRLLRLQLGDKLSWLYKHPGLSRECQLAWSATGKVESLVRDLVDSSLVLAAGDTWGIRDANAFEQLAARTRSRIGGISRQQADILNDIIPRVASLQRDLAKGRVKLPADSLADVREQLADLVYPGFLAELEPGHLPHFPRYLAAVEERLQQAALNPQRESQRLKEVEPFQRLYRERLESGADYDEALDRFRWLLAEFRVSVFAQRLGTDGKVSAKRLQQAWAEVLQGRR